MTKKTLHDYMMGLRKDHKFVVRIAMCIPTDEQMKRIEGNLKAYELVDITSPHKTIIQAHPLGFDEPINSEVVIFEVTLGLPASSFYLGRQIAKILKISDMYVVVNGADNPLHDEDDKEEKPVEPVAFDDLYGEKYNTAMLKTILAARDADPLSIVSTPSKTKK